MQLMRTLFLKLTKIMATRKRQIRRFQRPPALTFEDVSWRKACKYLQM